MMTLHGFLTDLLGPAALRASTVAEAASNLARGRLAPVLTPSLPPASPLHRVDVVHDRSSAPSPSSRPGTSTPVP